MEFLKKLRDNLLAVGSIVLVLLFGWLYIKKSGQDADAALKQNEEDKKKLAEIDKQIESVDEKLATEEKKREEIKKNIEEIEKSEDASIDDLAKYFDDPNNKPS